MRKVNVSIETDEAYAVEMRKLMETLDAKGELLDVLRGAAGKTTSQPARPRLKLPKAKPSMDKDDV